MRLHPKKVRGALLCESECLSLGALNVHDKTQPCPFVGSVTLLEDGVLL